MAGEKANPLWRFPGIAPAAVTLFAYMYLPIIILIAGRRP